MIGSTLACLLIISSSFLAFSVAVKMKEVHAGSAQLTLCSTNGQICFA